jgi:ribokinase
MIVVFGSINMDLITPVARIPRPGETVMGPSYSRVPGGKGANQAVAAARAGATVGFVGSRGDDAFGREAVAEMDKAGVDLSALAVSDNPTALAFITVDAAGENAIVVAAGANLDTEAGQLAKLDLPSGTILLLQREIREDALREAVRLARGQRWRVMLNAAPAGPVPDDVLRSLEALVINEHEVLCVAESAGLPATDAEAAGKALHERFGCQVVVTLGAAGAVAFVAGERLSAPALAVTPVDTTAAGDSFVGAYAAAVDRGMSVGQAFRIGAIAGSLACMKKGAQSSIPDRAAIERALASLPSY